MRNNQQLPDITNNETISSNFSNKLALDLKTQPRQNFGKLKSNSKNQINELTGKNFET